VSKKAAAIDKEEKERIAAELVTASEGLILVPTVMKAEWFPTPDRKNSTLIKRVYRKSKSLVFVNQKSLSTNTMSKSVSAGGIIEGQTVAVDGQSVASLSEPLVGSSSPTTDAVPGGCQCSEACPPHCPP